MLLLQVILSKISKSSREQYQFVITEKEMEAITINHYTDLYKIVYKK